MLLSIAAVPLWLAAHAFAADAAHAGSVASLLPFATFDAALRLVQYCTLRHSDAWFVSDHGSEAECVAAGGVWETRPGFEQGPEEAYNKLVEARNAEVRATGGAAVWVVRVAADAEYYDSRVDDWERVSGAAMADNMFVHERRQYFRLHATAEKVDALVGTGQFDVAMALPAELLVHPEVIVADQHAGAEEGAPLRSLRVSHAVSLEDRQRADRRREEMSRLQDEEERERFVARLVSESQPKLQACSFFEGCRIQRSGHSALVKAVPRGSLYEVAQRVVQEDASVVNVHMSPIAKAQNINAVSLTQSGTAGVDALTPLHNAGLHGENVLVSVVDEGLDHTSCFFNDPDRPVTFSGGSYSSTSHRKIRQYKGFSASNPIVDGGHGTHVVGTLLGESNAGNDSYNGVAYKSKVVFYDVKLTGDPEDVASTDDLPALTSAVLEPAYALGVRVFSNSWTLTSTAYHPISQELDLFINNHLDVLMLFSVGNNGEAGEQTVYAPATAKNVVGVGAANNEENPDLASFSSRGFTLAGLIKPTVVAPGASTTSAYSRAGSSEPHCDVGELSGTSMATPLAAGTAVLFQQYFQEGFYPTGKKNPADGFKPMGSLLHALLVNSGQKMTGTFANQNGKDWQNYGFGLVQADASAFLLGHSGFDLFVDGKFATKCSSLCPRLAPGASSTKTYQFKIRDNTHPFKVTLVWHDKMGGTAALVNDLDLKVYEGLQSTSPLAVNNLSPGQPDNKNIVEQVWVTSPTKEATYKVEVVGNALTGEAFFSLVVTGNFYKDDRYYANYIPVVSSGAYANGQLLLFGDRFGNDAAMIEGRFTCDGEEMDSTPLAASGDTVVFNVTIDDCDVIEGSMFAQTFYLKTIGSVQFSDASIAKSCKNLDPEVCAATMDCVVSGSKCKVSPEASERTGYTGEKDEDKGYGVYEYAIAAIVVFLGLVLVVGGYRACCRNDPNARNSEDSEEDDMPPVAAVAAVSSATSHDSLPRGWRAVVDGNTGRQYYWNVRTNETSWARPTEA